jgi:hypothetical protein
VKTDRKEPARPTWCIWKPLALGLVAVVLLCLLLGVGGIGSDAIDVLVSRAALEHAPPEGVGDR